MVYTGATLIMLSDNCVVILPDVYQEYLLTQKVLSIVARLRELVCSEGVMLLSPSTYSRYYGSTSEDQEHSRS